MRTLRTSPRSARFGRDARVMRSRAVWRGPRAAQGRRAARPAEWKVPAARAAKLAALVGAWWLLCWAPWWGIQAYVDRDGRELGLGKAKDAVMAAMADRPWYESWHRPDHFAFLPAERLGAAATVALGESDATVSVSSSWLQQTAYVDTAVAQPSFVLQAVVGEQSRYFALSEDGTVLADADTLRHHRRWAKVPSLVVRFAEKDFQELPALVVKPAAVPVEAKEIKNETGDTKPEAVPATPVAAVPEIPKPLLGAKILEQGEQNLRKNILWKSLSNDGQAGGWAWPAVGTNVMKRESAAAFLELNAGMQAAGFGRLVQRYAIAWPEPDKLSADLYEGGSVYFSLEQSAEAQMRSVLQVAAQNPAWHERLKYLDVRFGEKVYLKKR